LTDNNEETMTHEILIAGFGGQGVLSMGMTLAYAGMIEGNEISWMPSYGPEMRGGTANCIVIVSEKKISSPIISTYDVVVALNQPSLEKFEEKVKPGGILLYDSTNIIIPPTRTDITILPVPATEEADRLGNKRIGNMIVLGALLGRTEMLKVSSVVDALRKVLPERYHHLLPINRQALERGREIAEGAPVAELQQEKE
jgi:2-oxoglutarate ferredoxin oxidoreductase subunit gamma